MKQSEKERTYRRLNKAKNFLFYKRRQCKKKKMKKKVIIKSFTSVGRLRAVSLRIVVGGEGEGERERKRETDNSSAREPAAETMETLKN